MGCISSVTQQPSLDKIWQQIFVGEMNLEDHSPGEQMSVDAAGDSEMILESEYSRGAGCLSALPDSNSTVAWYAVGIRQGMDRPGRKEGSCHSAQSRANKMRRRLATRERKRVYGCRLPH